MPRRPKNPSGNSGGGAGGSGGTPINKTNLPTGQAYGARGGEARSLQAMPVPPQSNPVATPPAGAGASSSPAPAGGMSPAEAAQMAAAQHTFTPVGLGDPSANPNEPITSGLPTGPGANMPPPLIAPQAMGGSDPTLALLLAAYRANPTPGLDALISRYQVLNGTS